MVTGARGEKMAKMGLVVKNVFQTHSASMCAFPLVFVCLRGSMSACKQSVVCVCHERLTGSTSC